MESAVVALARRQTMESQHPQAMPVLDAYLRWLNTWIEDSNKTAHPTYVSDLLTIDDFFKWEGETAFISNTVLTRYGDRADYCIIQAGYGDDGGPSTLFAMVEWDEDTNTHHVVHILQEFDTNFTVIYDRTPDGKTFGLRCTPELVNAVPA